jgi:hypothetical protein
MTIENSCSSVREINSARVGGRLFLKPACEIMLTEETKLSILNVQSHFILFYTKGKLNILYISIGTKSALKFSEIP